MTTYAPVLELSGHEVGVINAARSVLEEMASRLRSHDTFEAGKCDEALEVASGALFDALNVLHSHGHVSMTEAQLHNMPTEVQA